MNWYLAVLKKYAVFSGRAGRSEYWFFVLFNVIISIVLGAIDALIFGFNAQSGMGLLGGLYSLAVLIPSIAVSVRRLHDTDRSGWWILIAFIPLIGAIVLLVFMVMGSMPGDNRFGAYPSETPDGPVPASE